MEPPTLSEKLQSLIEKAIEIRLIQLAVIKDVQSMTLLTSTQTN